MKQSICGIENNVSATGICANCQLIDVYHFSADVLDERRRIGVEICVTKETPEFKLLLLDIHQKDVASYHG